MVKRCYCLSIGVSPDPLNYYLKRQDLLAPASQERADQRRYVTDVGAFFYIENEGNEMICRVCRKILYESEREFNNGMCWYCEEDAKEPNIYDDIDCHPDYDPKTDSIAKPYTGGMEPRSVFPLMDELEAEWGVTDD